MKYVVSLVSRKDTPGGGYDINLFTDFFTASSPEEALGLAMKVFIRDGRALLLWSSKELENETATCSDSGSTEGVEPLGGKGLCEGRSFVDERSPPPSGS